MSSLFPRTLSILVIEDDPGDFGLIRADVRLAGLGYGGKEPVIWAKTLAEGIALAQRELPDVVLLDLSLPDSAGSDTVRAMRTALPNLPVVVLTGHDDDKLADAALEAGAQDFLVKGQFDHDALKRAVRHALVREAAEQKIQRLSQLYATLSQCNEAILHCTGEEALFMQICHDAVHYGGVKMAWVGLMDKADRQVKPVASCGDELGYLEGILVSVDGADPHGCGPTGTAIRENRPFWCQDFQQDPATAPWHERSKRSGWGASASLPLLRNGVPIGALTLYADAVNAFDEAARQLLIRMAGNISYALENFDREAERRKAAEKLCELNETLERRVEEEVVKNRKKDLLLIQQSRLASLGEMVHNISHHWRQPLTALGLAVQNIQLDYRDNLLSAEELDKYVASALKSIENMTRVIDDFRDFFRPSKERRAFLANDEVEKAIGLVGQAFARDNIEIVLEVGADACCAFGHPSEFAQVALYVLTNAKEAIDSKNSARNILIKVEKSANAIQVAIRNTGGNIPEDVLRKVFDPYFSTKESGAGIGLYRK